MPRLLQDTRDLLTLRFVLRQVGFAALVFVLFVVWLRLPDSRVVAVIGSALLGLLVLLVVFGGEAALLLDLRQRPRSRRALLLGGAALLVCVVLVFGWSVLLDHFSVGDELHAGYLNSRFPASFRNVFSYRHLLAIFHALWFALFWLFAVFLFVCGVSYVVAVRAGRAIRAALRSLTVWLALLASAAVAIVATKRLAGWTPGHGLAVESISLLLRFACMVTIDAVLLCFALCLVVAAAGLSDELYSPASTSAGTPLRSQERTAPNP